MSFLNAIIKNIAPLFIATSPITSYADQIYSIHKTRSSTGFSIDIPLIMLVASILKYVLSLPLLKRRKNVSTDTMTGSSTGLARTSVPRSSSKRSSQSPCNSSSYTWPSRTAHRPRTHTSRSSTPSPRSRAAGRTTSGNGAAPSPTGASSHT